MPKVSIVVPIFGVEKYIRRCAESLFRQTLDDLEFIFVNDCTQDKSMEVLQAVIDEYHPSNVKVITHQQNKGLPQARKTGIAAATGDYIVNCDSDDWVDPEFCGKLYNKACSSNADMVICSFWFADDTRTYEIEWGDSSVHDNHRLFFRYFLAEELPITIWTKLVRRKIAQKEEVLTPLQYSAEDWSFVVQWIYYCKKIEYVDSPPLYYYYVGNQTQSRHLTVENCIKNCCQKRDNVNMIIKWLGEKERLSNYSQEIVSIKAHTKRMLFPVMNNPECRKLWRRTYREVNIPILWNKYLPRIYKTVHFNYYLGRLYPLAVSVLHKFKHFISVFPRF